VSYGLSECERGCGSGVDPCMAQCGVGLICLRCHTAALKSHPFLKVHMSEACSCMQGGTTLAKELVHTHQQQLQHPEVHSAWQSSCREHQGCKGSCSTGSSRGRRRERNQMMTGTSDCGRWWHCKPRANALDTRTLIRGVPDASCKSGVSTALSHETPAVHP